MATAAQIGPLGHGQPMTLEEFTAADWQEGYQYELIDGKLYVAPLPNLPENRLEEWAGGKLRDYARRYPRVVNFVTSKARVYVRRRRGTTNPEPDLACTREYWGLDGRENPDHPRLTVHRRHGKQWRIIDVGPGEKYTTRLLPGFELTLDPRS